MSKEQFVNLFDTEAYSAGGFFTPGLYKIVKGRFGKYDFNGQASEPVTCYNVELEPQGFELEENPVQHYSVGKDFKEANGGKSLIATGKKATINKNCNFAFFMQHLGKSGFDMSQYEGDISVLDDVVAEFGIVPGPERTDFKSNVDGDDAEKKDGEKKKSKDVVVIVGIPRGNKGGTKKETKKETAKEETEDKPKKKKSGTSAEDVLGEALQTAVLTKANEDGIKLMPARLAIGQYCKKNDIGEDVKDAVLELFNDDATLGPVLKALGWSLAKGVIKKDEN